MPSNERGGRRPNAGRKPGRDLQGRLPQPPQGQERSTTVTPLPSGATDPALLRAVAMRARGATWVSIAEALGRDRETVQRWVTGNPELVTAAVEDLVGASPRKAFSHLLPATMNAFEETLEDREPRNAGVRLQAAVKVAEYVYDKPVTRTEITSNVMPPINIFSQTINEVATQPGFRESAPIYDADSQSLTSSLEVGS